MRLLLDIAAGGTGAPTEQATLPAATSQPVLLGTSGGSIWELLGALLLVAMVLAGGYWLLRRFGNRSMGARSIQVLERAPLTRDAALVIIRRNGREMLLGVTKEHITLLETLPEAKHGGNAPPPEANAADNAAGQAPENGFWKRFGHNLLVTSGLKKAPPMRPAEPDAAPERQDFRAVLNQFQRNGETISSPHANPISVHLAESGRYHVEGQETAPAEPIRPAEEPLVQNPVESGRIRQNGHTNPVAPVTPEVPSTKTRPNAARPPVTGKQNAAAQYAALNRQSPFGADGETRDGGVTYVPANREPPGETGHPDTVDELLDKISKRTEKYKKRP